MDITLYKAAAQHLYNYLSTCASAPTDHPSCDVFWASTYLIGLLVTFTVFLWLLRRLYNEEAIESEFKRRVNTQASNTEKELGEPLKWNPFTYIDINADPELAERIKKVIRNRPDIPA